MKFFRRRRLRMEPQILIAPPVMVNAQASFNNVTLADHPEIPAEHRARIAKALEPFPLDKLQNSAFFGVPIGWFSKDELIRIVGWVGENARDKRRDS